METNECPNGTLEPIYDNHLTPPRLIGHVKRHVWKYDTKVEVINGVGRHWIIQVCSLCGQEK